MGENLGKQLIYPSPPLGQEQGGSSSKATSILPINPSEVGVISSILGLSCLVLAPSMGETIQPAWPWPHCASVPRSVCATTGPGNPWGYSWEAFISAHQSHLVPNTGCKQGRCIVSAGPSGKLRHRAGEMHPKKLHQPGVYPQPLCTLALPRNPPQASPSDAPGSFWVQTGCRQC